MASLHCTPRPRRAPFIPLFKKEKLCFCTEELGSESISNPSASNSAASLDIVEAVSPRSQSLNGSIQELEANDNASFYVSNTKDAELFGCTASQCANLSPHMYARGPARVRPTFPPPITSLLSDRQIMRTCKFDGRFVLQRISRLGNSPFCAIRENGRLRLVAASSSSCGLDDVNTEALCAEDAPDDQVDKHRESTPNAVELRKALQPSIKTRGADRRVIVEDKVSPTISIVCVPRSSLRLFSPWDTAIHNHCLPALRLLLLVADAQLRLRNRREVSTSFVEGMWKKKPKGKIGRLYSGIEDSLLLKGTQQVISSSSSSSTFNITDNPALIGRSSIEDEHNILKEKAVQLEAIAQGKLGHAIIPMKLGLIMEISRKGTLNIVLQAKGLYLPPSISSNFAFNFLKPLDLRLESTCH